MDLNQPLAYRVRPKTIEEFVGQEEVLGKNTILYKTIQADRLSSLILWGPPGCGKTSIGRVISGTTKCKFVKLNAVTSGTADIKKAIEEAKNLFLNPTGKCILFIDEIHRFNKLQQDALLPSVEDGTVILIG
ncbi:MAG: AAA family ATPase, partial [Oscillospiraceae bacterium]|nr:AAA family ATPase [Oscillospiraceae bacterium]